MPRLGPIRRADLIHYLRRLGFDGPYAGGKHQFMIREDVTITVSNPHTGDIGKDFSSVYYGKLESIERSGRTSET